MVKKGSKFLIRGAQAEDLAVCQELEHSQESSAVWQMKMQREEGSYSVRFDTLRLPRPIRVAYPKDPATLQAQPANPGAILVAEGQAMLLGYVQVQIVPGQGAWVRNLVVHEPLRRKRIGTALLQQAQAWAKTQQASLITVETTTRSYPAIQFLQGQGFLFCGFNELYYANQEIAVFFGKRL